MKTANAAPSFSTLFLRNARGKQPAEALPVFDSVVHFLKEQQTSFDYQQFVDTVVGSPLSASEWQLLDRALDGLDLAAIEAELSAPPVVDKDDPAVKFAGPFGKSPMAMARARAELARHLGRPVQFRDIESLAEEARAIPAYAAAPLKAFVGAAAEAVVRCHGKLTLAELVAVCSFAERVSSSGSDEISTADARALFALYPELSALSERRDAIIDATFASERTNQSAVMSAASAAAGINADVEKAVDKLRAHFRLEEWRSGPFRFTPITDLDFDTRKLDTHIGRLSPLLGENSNGESAICYRVSPDTMTRRLAHRLVVRALVEAGVEDAAAIPHVASVGFRDVSGRNADRLTASKSVAATNLEALMTRPEGFELRQSRSEKWQRRYDAAVNLLEANMKSVSFAGQRLEDPEYPSEQDLLKAFEEPIVMETLFPLDAENTEHLVSAARLFIKCHGGDSMKGENINAIDIVVKPHSDVTASGVDLRPVSS